MRRRLLIVSVAALLAVPATAGAQSGGAQGAAPAGGVQYGQPTSGAPSRPRVATFSVAPPTLQPGGDGVRFTFRVSGRARSARLRIEIVPAAGGRPVRRLSLGRRRTDRTRTFRWAPRAGEIAPGGYVARLHAVDTAGHRLVRTATASGRIALQVVPPVAPPPPATAGAGVFPVQGPWTFGGPDARFGTGRDGHVHQGQDIPAASGTPVVAPRAGFIYWRAYQAGGAGNYLVLRADDGRDYVFMHLLDGSLAVTKGDVVTAGGQIAAVGSTGTSSGPHLHFEIWPEGWYASPASEPIDPLPDLQAWAGQR